MYSKSDKVYGAILGAIIGIIIVVAFSAFAPIILIWALNTLFVGLAIPFTFKTWISIVIILSAIHSRPYASIRGITTNRNN